MRPPYGLRYGPHGLTRCDVEYPILLLIFRRYIKLQSIQSLARWLNTEGHLNKNGDPWSPQGLSWLLRNESYRRPTLPHRTPAITEWTFTQVQWILRNNKK
jgi:hypothetical protein